MSLDEILTRLSVHVALLCYVVGLLAAMTGRRHPRWQATARALWTAGCSAFLVHVAAAFHFHYGWSHEVALSETARQTFEAVGVASGAGLWLNYLFTLLWVGDAAYWWSGLERYRERPVAVDAALHGFFLFMAVNATIVFEEGGVRWSAAAVLAGLALAGIVMIVRRAVRSAP